MPMSIVKVKKALVDIEAYNVRSNIALFRHCGEISRIFPNNQEQSLIKFILFLHKSGQRYR